MKDCPNSLLLIGGARSGKSRYGQRYAEKSGKKPVLIATAEAGDPEMAARIAAHKAARPEYWQFVEEPLDLAGALRQETAEERVLLIDCLTLWLSNILHDGRDPAAETSRLLEAVARLKGPAIFISNEVGLGIVPENQLGRTFRDAQGSLNQAVAAVCEAVIFIAAGLPLSLKPAPWP